jgi:hypothetical protein
MLLSWRREEPEEILNLGSRTEIARPDLQPEGRKLPRGGFKVTYMRRGPDARRARYDPPPIQQIEINVDYPELACAGVSSSLFRSLSYEIAIGEYASAVVRIMADCGYVDVEDSADSALAQWGRIVNRLGIAITPLIRLSLEQTEDREPRTSTK